MYEKRRKANERMQQIEIRNQNKINDAQKNNQMIAEAQRKLKEAHKETVNTLQKFYEKNILHHKYRNITSLIYIYDYIDTGICAGLEGTDGAYRQYETDVRLDRINSNLDAVIAKMDMVIEKLDHIYSKVSDLSNEMRQAMGGIQRTIDRVSQQIEAQAKKLDEIGVNTATTAYTVQVIERNQYYERNWNNGRGFSERVNMSSI